MSNKRGLSSVITHLVILLCLTIPQITGATTKSQAQPKAFKVGGVLIHIPSPTSEFIEVGDDKRKFMEVFTPPGNRLISGFVLEEDLHKIGKSGDTEAFSQYAMIDILSEIEHKDCSEKYFREAVDGIKEAFRDNTAVGIVKGSVEELNRRLKSLDIANRQLSIDKPLQLGVFFSKANASGFGMITRYSAGDRNIKMVVGGALLRVKKRLLNVYFCAEYKNDDTVRWIRKMIEVWCDAILTANK